MTTKKLAAGPVGFHQLKKELDPLPPEKKADVGRKVLEHAELTDGARRLAQHYAGTDVPRAEDKAFDPIRDFENALDRAERGASPHGRTIDKKEVKDAIHELRDSEERRSLPEKADAVRNAMYSREKLSPAAFTALRGELERMTTWVSIGKKAAVEGSQMLQSILSGEGLHPTDGNSYFIGWSQASEVAEKLGKTRSSSIAKAVRTLENVDHDPQYAKPWAAVLKLVEARRAAPELTKALDKLVHDGSYHGFSFDRFEAVRKEFKAALAAHPDIEQLGALRTLWKETRAHIERQCEDPWFRNSHTERSDAKTKFDELPYQVYSMYTDHAASIDSTGESQRLSRDVKELETALARGRPDITLYTVFPAQPAGRANAVPAKDAAEWPLDGAPIDSAKLIDPVLDVLRQAYKIKVHVPKQEVWTGPAGSRAFNEDTDFSARLSPKKLAASADPLREILSVALEMGMEQGTRLALGVISERNGISGATRKDGDERKKAIEGALKKVRALLSPETVKLQPEMSILSFDKADQRFDWPSGSRAAPHAELAKPLSDAVHACMDLEQKKNGDLTWKGPKSTTIDGLPKTSFASSFTKEALADASPLDQAIATLLELGMEQGIRTMLAPRNPIGGGIVRRVVDRLESALEMPRRDGDSQLHEASALLWSFRGRTSKEARPLPPLITGSELRDGIWAHLITIVQGAAGADDVIDPAKAKANFKPDLFAAYEKYAHEHGDKVKLLPFAQGFFWDHLETKMRDVKGGEGAGYFISRAQLEKLTTTVIDGFDATVKDHVATDTANAELAAAAAAKVIDPILADGAKIGKSAIFSYVRASGYELTSRARKSYEEIDPALVHQNYPPDLASLFTQLGGERGVKISDSQLSSALQLYAEKVLAALPEDFQPAELPPSLRYFYRKAQDFERYSSRADRARAGEPFPDGVVLPEFVFRHYFENIGHSKIDGLLNNYQVKDQMVELFAKLKDGPIELADGTKVSSSAEKPHAGDVELTCFRSKGPYLVFQKGNEVLAASWDAGNFWPKLSFHLFSDITKSKMQSTETHLQWQTLPDDFPEELKARMGAEKGFRLEGDPGVEVLAKIAANLDQVFQGGVHHDQILGFSIEQEKTNVTAEYLRRMGDEGQGAVKMLQEIAAMVPKLEDIALGDADLYIEIKPKHTATFWDDDKEEDRTKTLVDKRGPLLTFHNAASGASFAVELDALKDGRLEAHRFYDGDPNGKVSLDRQGQPLGLIDSRGIESFVFELSWALSDLREMVAEQKA